MIQKAEQLLWVRSKKKGGSNMENAFLIMVEKEPLSGIRHGYAQILIVDSIYESTMEKSVSVDQ